MEFLLCYEILVSIYGHMLLALVMMIILQVVLPTVFVLDTQKQLLLHLLESINYYLLL